MENLLSDSITQLGAVGILVSVLIWLIVRREKQIDISHKGHASEREAWREQAATQHEDIVQIAKESHTLLAEIKTILEKR